MVMYNFVNEGREGVLSFFLFVFLVIFGFDVYVECINQIFLNGKFCVKKKEIF